MLLLAESPFKIRRVRVLLRNGLSVEREEEAEAEEEGVLLRLLPFFSFHFLSLFSFLNFP